MSLNCSAFLVCELFLNNNNRKVSIIHTDKQFAQYFVSMSTYMVFEFLCEHDFWATAKSAASEVSLSKETAVSWCGPIAVRFTLWSRMLVRTLHPPGCSRSFRVDAQSPHPASLVINGDICERPGGAQGYCLRLKRIPSRCPAVPAGRPTPSAGERPPDLRPAGHCFLVTRSVPMADIRNLHTFAKFVSQPGDSRGCLCEAYFKPQNQLNKRPSEN